LQPATENLSQLILIACGNSGDEAMLVVHVYFNRLVDELKAFFGELDERATAVLGVGETPD
jgi:hypothetical protein